MNSPAPEAPKPVEKAPELKPVIMMPCHLACFKFEILAQGPYHSCFVSATNFSIYLYADERYRAMSSFPQQLMEWARGCCAAAGYNLDDSAGAITVRAQYLRANLSQSMHYILHTTENLGKLDQKMIIDYFGSRLGALILLQSNMRARIDTVSNVENALKVFGYSLPEGVIWHSEYLALVKKREANSKKPPTPKQKSEAESQAVPEYSTVTTTSSTTVVRSEGQSTS